MSKHVDLPESYARAGDVTGKRVVITGASRGLGRLLATAFSRGGARVALVARTEADLKAGVDAWICNAGISPVVAGPRKTSASVWRAILDVNLTGAFLGARAAARVMGDGGRIIFTGSVLGERPREGLAAYSASKAGLVGMAKALALDLASDGITVNVVAPGWFDSPLVEPWKHDPDLGGGVLAHTALKRWGAPEDLVGAYEFLASDSSAFVTGTVFTVDGGYLLV